MASELNEGWLEWPMGFGYYWVVDTNMPDKEPEVKYVAPASCDCPFELWDCPGIARRRMYEIGTYRYRKIAPPK